MAQTADLLKFKRYLKRDWYIQGFSAVPLFLSVAAASGFTMKKYLGFGYKHFFFNYHHGYGEMCYDPADFKRIWRLVKKKLARDPRYLQKIKKLYHQNLNRYKFLLAKINTDNLRFWSDDELLYNFQRLLLAQIDNVGVSHLIDAIGVEIEPEFRKRLAKELPAVSPAKFNMIFARLITPSQASFVNREEIDLLSIRGGAKNRAALVRHAAKYYWLQSSYAGPVFLTSDDFRIKLINLKKERAKNKKFSQPPLKYKFSPSLKKMISIIDYCAIWQDERKALLFQNIGYAGLVVREIARRLHQPEKTFYYLGLREPQATKTLADLGRLAARAAQREAGCLFIFDGRSDQAVSGAAYRQLLKGRRTLLKENKSDQRELHGTVANTGTAVGRVRIIKNLASLKKFRRGDILVASMTRPELMSAIKKAAAIVTDEGGLTCHAAIIAREMNIPAVIGTRVATQVLKEGSRVEVRATHGLVRILD